MSGSDAGGYPRPGIGSDRATDLAWAVLDDFATRGRLHGVVRDALYTNLDRQLRGGERDSARHTLQAFIDCWPLGALVDEARGQWCAGPHPEALAILGRAAEVIGLAVDWPTGSGGPWPVPDKSWHAAHPGPWDAPPDQECPELAQVSADALVDARGAWVSRVVHGPVLALDVVGTASNPESFGLAMGEVRMEAPAQRNFERFGHAGLLIGDAPSFEALLQPAPAGFKGGVLTPCADGIVLPVVDEPVAEGTTRNVGWLLWSGPIRPRKVAPVAVHFLQALDGEAPLSKVQAQLDLTGEECDMVVEMLVEMGAVTAAPSSGVSGGDKCTDPDN